MSELRETHYAKELVRATQQHGPNDEVRLERLYIKEHDREEIRFSWWPNGRMAQKPLDVTEPELLDLLEEGLKQGIFTADFLEQLKALLNRS